MLMNMHQVKELKEKTLIMDNCKPLLDFLFKVSKAYMCSKYRHMYINNSHILGIVRHYYNSGLPVIESDLLSNISYYINRFSDQINQTVIDVNAFLLFYKNSKDSKSLKRNTIVKLYLVDTNENTHTNAYEFEVTMPDDVDNVLPVFFTETIDDIRNYSTSILDCISYHNINEKIYDFEPMWFARFSIDEFVDIVLKPKDKIDESCLFYMDWRSFNINNKFKVELSPDYLNWVDSETKKLKDMNFRINNDVYFKSSFPKWFYISKNIIPKEVLISDSLKSIEYVNINFMIDIRSYMVGILIVDIHYRPNSPYSVYEFSMVARCVISCISNCEGIR